MYVCVVTSELSTADASVDVSDFLLVDNVGDDCPVFDGLFDYCSISAGGSMGEWVPYSSQLRVLREFIRNRGCSALESRQVRYCCELGGWLASRQEERGKRLLLCQWFAFIIAPQSVHVKLTSCL